jgi:hypothetical protein
MRYRQLLASIILPLALAPHAEAQGAKPAAEVIVAPFVIEADKRDTLRAQSESCLQQFVAALKLKGVKVARDPELSEKNLQSTAASWAVLGRISREKEQFQVELRLLEVKSGEELRSYFNADKELQAACRMVEKAADRIAAFVVEQRSQQ